jgi:phosphate-selective porin OprO/OprP
MNPIALTRFPKRTALAIAMLLATATVSAQSTESLSVPVGTAQGDKPAAPAEVDYAVPDLKTKPNGGMHQVNEYFSFKPSLALLQDFTYIDQDDDSIAQVGDQASQWQVRSARLTFLGSIGKDYKVSYQFGGEYKGFDTDPVQTWQLTDLSFTFPIGGPNNKLTIGKTKEAFAYEMVGDAANLPHSERVLSPFFVSRNMGVKMLHVFGEKKTMTLSYGLFNDTWDINSTSSRGMDYTARVTGLVWDVPDKNQFLHLGLALREVGADGSLRYRGRPESNVTDYYVDTGTCRPMAPSNTALRRFGTMVRSRYWPNTTMPAWTRPHSMTRNSRATTSPVAGCSRVKPARMTAMSAMPGG